MQLNFVYFNGWSFNVKQITIVLFVEAQVANVQYIHHLSALRPRSCQ